MKGLELSREFYLEIGHPVLAAACPQLDGKWAAGLVGEGSECYGFDDEWSRDHDWGPGFCIWLTEEQYQLHGEDMQRVYDKLPDTFKGYQKTVSPLAGKRVGVFSINRFYEHFLGIGWVPANNAQWLRIPETYLAVATNGEVFEDGLGVFTDIRNGLLGYYPEDVRRKKIAARISVMAREGQYNYPRCLKRQNMVAAFQAMAKFMEAAISVIYLLKKAYMPYYKWAYRGLEKWTELNHYRELLHELAIQPDQNLVEEIAAEVIWELRMQGMTEAEGNFLQDHCDDVMEGIKDKDIRSRHILEG